MNIKKKNKKLQKQVDSLLDTIDGMKAFMEEQQKQLRFATYAFRLLEHYVAGKDFTVESKEEVIQGYIEWQSSLTTEEKIEITSDPDDEEDETSTDSDSLEIKGDAEPKETQQMWSMDEVLNELNTPKKDD